MKSKKQKLKINKQEKDLQKKMKKKNKSSNKHANSG